MAQVSEASRILVKDWKGRVSNADAKSIPPGAFTECINLTTNTPGALQGRRGIRPCSFTNAGTAISSQIIGMYTFLDETGQLIVYELLDGTLRMGRGVS